MHLALAMVMTMAAGVGAETNQPAAEAPAKTPIPAGLSSFLERDYKALELKWHRRVLVEGYEKFGRKDPAWDRAARNLLGLCALQFADAPEAPAKEELLQAAKSLMESGCKDPAVRMCIGMVLATAGEYESAYSHLSYAVTGFQEAPYPKGLAFLPLLVLLVSRAKSRGRRRRPAGGTAWPSSGELLPWRTAVSPTASSSFLYASTSARSGLMTSSRSFSPS